MLLNSRMRRSARTRLQRAGAALIVAIMGSLLLTGCFERRGGNVPYSPTGFSAPDKPAALVDADTRKIAPLDLLTVNIYQVPDLSSDVQVDATGSITLPLVGEVTAKGLTNRELSAKLVQLYGAKYLQDPTILVTTKQAATKQITVDGSVGAPGVYPIDQPITLIQAIALARGTSKDANPRRIVIFRQVEGQRMAAAFDLTDIRHGKMKDPQVYGDDIIVVDGSSTRSTLRDALSTLPIVGLFTRF